jgi:hypothetical protein
MVHCRAPRFHHGSNSDRHEFRRTLIISKPAMDSGIHLIGRNWFEAISGRARPRKQGLATNKVGCLEAPSPTSYAVIRQMAKPRLKATEGRRKRTWRRGTAVPGSQNSTGLQRVPRTTPATGRVFDTMIWRLVFRTTPALATVPKEQRPHERLAAVRRPPGRSIRTTSGAKANRASSNFIPASISEDASLPAIPQIAAKRRLACVNLGGGLSPDRTRCSPVGQDSSCPY